MDYAEALTYLDSLIGAGIKTGLARTKRLAAELGDPQKTFPSLLIAGTNGKGSTAAFLESILRQAGFRCGLFTSPHLVDVRERIRIGEYPIERGDFAYALNRVCTAVRRSGEEGHPTYFESLTLAAFDYFARRKVDLAVLEVGLGGRLDCTNIVTPILSVVTRIGLDHEEWLGRDLVSIAREKAGIFRKGAVAVTAAGREEVTKLLEGEAAGVGARLIRGEERLELESRNWCFSWRERSIILPYPPLPGRHQIDNASLAVRCAWSLDKLGWTIPDEAISSGIARVQWPGRLELVGSSPDTYLDGAHNPDGCRALAAFVASLSHRRKALVFAAMRDKRVERMIPRILPEFGAAWFTSVPMERCASPGELSSLPGNHGVRVEVDPLKALEDARSWAGPGGLVVAAGSLYLVGFIRKALIPPRNGPELDSGSGR